MDSNKKTSQTRLSGEIIPEERYFLLGFVSSKILKPDQNNWIIELNSQQISAINEFLEKTKYY
jgi:hypothetical protein